MLLLISPAKTLDFEKTENEVFSQPRFLSQSKKLIKELKRKSTQEISDLMKISNNLAELNVKRYQKFEVPFTLDNSKQAILAFKGDVYVGLNPQDFDKEDLKFSQQGLRVLSGLYGLLRPLDLIQPYRLEMGTKLNNSEGKNLYEFWGENITKSINEDLEDIDDKIVVNLASKEYFKAINPTKINGKIYNIHFKEEKEGGFKIVAFFAKKARGMMCHYIIKNKITSIEAVKGFNYNNYLFNEELSSESDLVFTR